MFNGTLTLSITMFLGVTISLGLIASIICIAIKSRKSKTQDIH